MKKKKKIILFASIIIVIGGIIGRIYFLLSWNFVQLNRTFERTGLIQNKFNINLDSTIDKESLELYWMGYLNDGQKNPDTLLIYRHNQLANNIPDVYHDNTILIKYKNYLIYDKISIVKLYAWYKHNYYFDIREIDGCLIIDWNISNKHEEFKRIDTVCINNLNR